MAKKRKTREEKILADLRHSFTHSQGAHKVISEAKNKPETQSILIPQYKNQATVSVSAYPYLVKDLSKTAILTGAILVFQVALYFLLKNHVLIIPGLIY